MIAVVVLSAPVLPGQGVILLGGKPTAAGAIIERDDQPPPPRFGA